MADGDRMVFQKADTKILQTMKTKAKQLSKEEQAVEDALDPLSIRSATSETLDKVRNGLEELRQRRGGKRPGAGRKPKPHTPTLLNLSPMARANLERMAAGQRGGMSAVVNRLLENSGNRK